jgi:uncharacterized protein YciI
VLEAADRAAVADLPDEDPFHVLGLIAEREVREWRLAFGAERLRSTGR